MYSPCKKLTAQLLLFSFLLESCYNPHIGVSKKIPSVPKGAIHQQHQYEENTYSKNLEPSTSFSYTTADGYAITFTHHNQAWQAEVYMPNGRRQLPMTFEPGYTIEDLADKDPQEQQQLIHICPNKDNIDPIDHIYVGKAENNEQYINKIITKKLKKHSQTAETSTQEQAGLQILPSPTQPIPVSSNSQPQASSMPPPIPIIEPFGYNNAQKIPNKITPSLKSQHALTHSQRAAQIKRAERTAKPLNEPAPTAHLKQTTPSTTLPSSLADEAPQDIASPIFVAQGGQRVHFIYKNDQWQASVREQIGAFSRTEVLPVFCERYGDIATALLALQGKPDKYVQQRIHVMTARQIPYVPKFVYLGERGLKGGGNCVGKVSNSVEPLGELAGEDTEASGSGQSQPLVGPQEHEAALADAFFDTIRENDTARVSELLQQDSSLLAKIVSRDNGQGAMRERTSLMYAAQLGNTSMASLLLGHGADVNQAANDGWTPLMIASQEGYLEVVQYLVENGADVNQSSNDGYTPLFMAASNGHQAMVKCLVEHGAAVNQVANDGWTPLHIASQNGYQAVVQYLVENGADVNQAENKGATPLWITAQEDHLETMRYLIEQGASVDQADNKGATPLMIAAHQGHQAVAQYLVEQRALVNRALDNGATPLMLASQEGHLEMVQYLVGQGADVNQAEKDDITPLHIASQNGHLAVVQYLVVKRADVNQAEKYGATPLYVASQKGHLEVVQYLVGQGADVNQAKNNGVTSLYIASQKGHLEVVQCLVGHGADVNQAKNNGVTSLYIASQKGHLEVVQCLVGNGAEINQAGPFGATPLMIAVVNGHLNVAKFLVEQGSRSTRPGMMGLPRS